ncbi:DUF5819 family protein [Paenibacillus tianmuensis]|uniref:DUF5819 family protein n=1 Tax=Paenibacillus tianmuensis TaxID=624147 RepID=UPI00115FBD83|nr:DUF5819 family protein [Paenibacillus tianmuensis]
MKTGKLQRGALLFLPFLLVGFMVFHFSIIFMHVLPFNPMTSKFNGLVRWYTSTVFYQNWHLFAPDPISTNYTIYMQAKLQNANHEQVESEWIDLTTPMITSNWEQYISPVNRLMRFGTDSFMQTVHQDELAEKLEVKKQKFNKQDLTTSKENQKILEDFRSQGIDLMYRMGYSNVPKYFPNQQVDSIRMRVTFAKVKPFSERNNPDYKTVPQYVDYHWKDYIPVIPSI